MQSGKCAVLDCDELTAGAPFRYVGKFLTDNLTRRDSYELCDADISYRYCAQCIHNTMVLLETHAVDCGGENGEVLPTVTVMKNSSLGQTAIVFHKESDDDIQVGQEIKIKGKVSGRY